MTAIDTTTPAPQPQHMQALAQANRVRLARAELKRQIAEGDITAAEVVMDCPWEAETMPLDDLLMAQRRWGRGRTNRFLGSLQLSTSKHVGALTLRQRLEVHDRLTGRLVEP